MQGGAITSEAATRESACSRRMRAIPSCVAWLAAALLSCTCLAAEPITVSIQRNGDTFLIRADVAVTVDPATAWQVLTDYNQLADFVPDMQVSRVISVPPQPFVIEQRGESGFLVFRAEIRVMLQLDEAALERISFKAIGGNLKRMEGEWRIVREAVGIRLRYRADIEPDFWVAPLIGDAILKGHVTRQIEGVANEMTRRHAAAKTKPSAGQ